MYLLLNETAGLSSLRVFYERSLRIRGLGLLQNESVSLGSLRRYGSTRLCVSEDFSAEKGSKD